MQNTHYAIRTHTLIVPAELHLVAHQWLHLLFKLSLAKTLKEVTTSITKEAWFNNKHALYICLYYVLIFIFNNYL